MALSGTLTGTCVANNGASSRYDYKIEWSATQNITANTSTITATAYVRSNNSAYSTSTNWTSIINGTTVKTFSAFVQASAGWINFGSKTWTVNHNADGTCTTSITGSFSGTYNASYVLRSGSVSGNITLNTIPRASSFTLNRTSGTIGTDAITVNISRASSSFTHTVIYKFGSIQSTKATKTTATSVTFTPSLSDSAQIPNATSGTATIVVDTYNGNTKVGTSSKTLTLNVPSSVVPTIGSVTATGNNLLGSVYVAGKSTVTAKINSPAGAQGSTIKSYHLSGAGINSTSASATSGTLSAGTYTLTGKVTDSRGRSASKSTSITVHSYASPTLSVSVYRANSSGNAQDDGTYVMANISAVVSNVGNANVNAKQYKVEWKRSTSSSWATLKDWTNLSSYSSTTSINLGDGWLNTTTYEVRISVKDSYTTVSVTKTISTVACLLNVEQAGVGVGKIHERGALDVGGILYTTGDVYTGGAFRLLFDPNSYARFGYDASTSDVFIANTNNSWLRLKGDKTMTYAGYKVYTSYEKPTPSEIGASRALTLANGYYGLTHNDGTTSDWIRTTQNGIIPYQSGGAGGLGTSGWPFNNTYSVNVFATNIKSRSNSDSLGLTGLANLWLTSGNGTTGSIFAQTPTFKPYANAYTNLGDNSSRWKAVYSSNGTIQTSDERFKIKQGFTDIEECYRLVKGVNIYNYIMLNQNKEDLSKNRLGKQALLNNQESTNVHMGIMAQDLQEYKCAKQILVEGEYTRSDGTSDTILSINPYNLTTAVMGALKEEIRLREESDEDKDKRITALEQELEILKGRITVGA